MQPCTRCRRAVLSPREEAEYTGCTLNLPRSNAVVSERDVQAKDMHVQMCERVRRHQWEIRVVCRFRWYPCSHVLDRQQSEGWHTTLFILWQSLSFQPNAVLSHVAQVKSSDSQCVKCELSA